MEVYDFMTTVKERLQAQIANASVTVEPHDNESVKITMEWWTGPRYGIQRIVSIKEILQRNGDIIEYYVALFEHLKADAIRNDESYVFENKPKYTMSDRPYPPGAHTFK